MENHLEFNANNYTVKSLTIDNQTINFRAYENIIYVKKPMDTDYQMMNIFVPEAYYEGKCIGHFTAETAPIFLPITVGGYMPGAPERPGKNRTGQLNAAFVALSKGYVVAAPGARGRTLQNKTGQYTGIAPACIVDLKAAIRYLRFNDPLIPGGKEKIISNGTSAGGALSSLLAATGNHADYEPYLEKLGAAKERDDVFAASCYCPITNLEHADTAYEWMFNGIHEYHKMVFIKDGDEIKFKTVHGTMTAEQMKLSDEVKEFFPTYLNGLRLKAANGEDLTLDEHGEGSFKNYVKSFVIDSAQKALANGSDLSGLTWITIEDDIIKDIDFDQYVQYATRMKSTLAFDDVDLNSPENELFGTALVKAQHFTEFSMRHSSDGSLAHPGIVKMMNPMNYIGNIDNVTSFYWRIRHGAIDRDTALAIPVILATKLENNGFDVDFSLPWEQGHGGDYDLVELFAWIEKITT